MAAPLRNLGDVDREAGMSSANERSVAIVTGAASGIGRATAERLAGAGYRVAVNDLAPSAGLDALALSIDGVACAGDVASPEDMTDLVGRASDLGRLRVVVSNAGFYVRASLVDTDDQLWDRMLAVHLGGLVNLARAAVPSLREAGAGSIVAVASELALIGTPHAAAYVAAKAAVIGVVRSLALELAPAIRVNAVAPGPVDTPLLPAAERTSDYIGSIPLRRLGRADEIAEAIVHLAEATWTTGQVLSPNGGVVIQ